MQVVGCADVTSCNVSMCCDRVTLGLVCLYLWGHGGLRIYVLALRQSLLGLVVFTAAPSCYHRYCSSLPNMVAVYMLQGIQVG